MSLEKVKIAYGPESMNYFLVEQDNKGNVANKKIINDQVKAIKTEAIRPCTYKNVINDKCNYKPSLGKVDDEFCYSDACPWYTDKQDSLKKGTQ